MKHHPALAVLAALTLLLCAMPCSASIVHVKWDSPGPAFDGTSWDAAYRTIQAGLDAAVSGDEVWVARGVYVQSITLKSGVALYGGFAGTETSKGQRNVRTNVTVIDAAGADNRAVSTPTGATSATRLDGFTVRNSFCSGVSYGESNGAIYCVSHVTIANNTIMGNGRSGIQCATSSSPTITNNIVRGNGAYGIYCDTSSTPAITNNTIVANNLSAIYCWSSASPAISNNIVAFNSAGIHKWSSGTPTLRNNCVYRNTRYNYSGLSAGTGDISVDPLLADKVYGNTHIQPGSPCTNAGWSDAPGLPSTDVDDQARVQDGTVDIGADESDGTTWSAGPGIIVRVSPSGNDANDGSSWALAKRTVWAGISAAWTLGGEVWVKAGTYTEATIELYAYVYAYGGFAGTETSRSGRNWTANQTTVAGAVSARRTGYLVSSIDGFMLRNPLGGRGVFCQYASPIIADNTIISRSSGVDCTAQSSPIVANNVIVGNTTVGVNCDNSSPTIVNNKIAGNGTVGIYCGYYSSPSITNNTITMNRAEGVYLRDSSPTISNNIIAFNNSTELCKVATGTPILRNNCVYAGSYSGISPGVGDISVDPLLADAAYGSVHVQPNSPCRNAGWNGAPGLPSIDMDGQLRVQDGTVDIGADESDGASWPAGPNTIVRVSTSGSDANDGASWTSAKRTVQAAIEVVTALGGDVWVKAGTYNERITLKSFAYVYGGFAGTETSKLQRNWTANRTILDGGAAGPVVSVEQQGSSASTIDGFTIRNGRELSYGGAAGISCSSNSPAIRNNTITANNGVGVAISSCSPVVTNNIIAGNSGAGIVCFGGRPKITNNTITGNTSSYPGGGILMGCQCEPTISNNIIAFNSSGLSAGCGDPNGSWPAPTLQSNCVYGNTGANYDGCYPGDGDISLDPLFADRTGGDYHLTALSPCRNAGWSGAVGLPTFDMDGEGRIFGRKVDMGADEYWAPGMSISDARCAADGARISGGNAVVSAAFGGFIYIEADDRSSGIRVDKAVHGVHTGDRVDISGVLATNADGERSIEASQVTMSGMGSIEALLMVNRSIGGRDFAYNPATGAGQRGQKEYCLTLTGGSWVRSFVDVAGLNNIGLLVSTTGKVTYVGSGFFYLDDGSRLDDGSGYIGVKVTTEGQTMPALDSYVKVIGASSCYKRDGDLFRLIRATAINQ